jgi:hypothetical protein
MACNLGARPLGPILIKRFERLFDGPPKILKNHGKEGNTVTWLDVVEFARSKPEQFVLGQMSEGMRVCQIHTKQCRVQISEDDFMLISSGMPQKLIPPQPIVEDEEKELGTLEILEKNLSGISHLADQGIMHHQPGIKHRTNIYKQSLHAQDNSNIASMVDDKQFSNVAKTSQVQSSAARVHQYSMAAASRSRCNHHIQMTRMANLSNIQKPVRPPRPSRNSSANS